METTVVFGKLTEGKERQRPADREPRANDHANYWRVSCLDENGNPCQFDVADGSDLDPLRNLVSGQETKLSLRSFNVAVKKSTREGKEYGSRAWDLSVVGVAA